MINGGLGGGIEDDIAFPIVHRFVAGLNPVVTADDAYSDPVRNLAIDVDRSDRCWAGKRDLFPIFDERECPIDKFMPERLITRRGSAWA